MNTAPLKASIVGLSLNWFAQMKRNHDRLAGIHKSFTWGLISFCQNRTTALFLTLYQEAEAQEEMQTSTASPVF